MNKRTFRLTISTEWKVVAAFALTALILLGMTRTSLVIGLGWLFLPLFGTLSALTLIYHYLRCVPVLADLASATLKIFLILTFGMFSSYGAAALGGQFPYRDMSLQSADIAAGFDWLAYVDYFMQRPLLAQPLRFAYMSLEVQFFLVGAALAISRQCDRLRVYTLAIAATLAVTLIIFVFVPAHAHGWGSWTPQLARMREAGIHAIAINDLTGIITFPSYHMQGACLFIWACWRLAYLRWPVLVLNLAMIAATPVYGFHYAIDLLAGALITIAVIFFLSQKVTLSKPYLISGWMAERRRSA